MENSATQDFDNTELLEWYTDMIENYPNTFVHYLSEKALFHWFGRTVKGPEKILHFIKNNMNGTKHIFHLPDPTEKITACQKPLHLSSSFHHANTSESTPALEQTVIHKDELACGDGPNINHLIPNLNSSLTHLAQGGQGQGQGDCLPIESSSSTLSVTTKCLETNAAIEFSRPCFKRGVPETRWERPCFLKITYNGSLKNPFEFSIQQVVYGDNMTCKRNLLPEFEKCTESDDDKK